MLVDKMSAKIQTGDNVKIIAGNYRGTVGVVTKVVKKVAANGNVSYRAAVTNVAKIAKYRKSQSFQGQSYPGAKLEVDRMIDISNISLINPKGDLSRVKIVFENGKKLRTYSKGGKTVQKVSLPKTPAPAQEA